ncbi:MAG: hypothetical protein AB2697_12870 [Candidatus Thiodiazotropha endolucinida]
MTAPPTAVPMKFTVVQGLSLIIRKLLNNALNESVNIHIAINEYLFEVSVVVVSIILRTFSLVMAPVATQAAEKAAS